MNCNKNAKIWTATKGIWGSWHIQFFSKQRFYCLIIKMEHVLGNLEDLILKNFFFMTGRPYLYYLYIFSFCLAPSLILPLLQSLQK